MDDPVNVRDYGWTESSDSDISGERFADEVESVGQSSEDGEVPFARHGPIIEADTEEISVQRDFWSFCAIGFYFGL